MSEDRESMRSENEAKIREVGEVREEWIPIREAAAVLGISPRAVQLQAKSGKIASRKSGNRLLVNLATEQAPVISPAPFREERESNHESNESNESIRELRDDSQLVEQLRGEVDYLRGELTAAREGRDKSEGEWRLILAAKEQTEQDLRRQLAALEKQLAIAPGPDGVTPAAVTQERPTDQPPAIEPKKRGGFFAGIWRAIVNPWER